MSNAFHVTVASDRDYENLVAEIYIDDVYIGLISEETQGNRLFEIASFPPTESRKIDPAIFMAAFQHAMARLDSHGWRDPRSRS